MPPPQASADLYRTVQQYELMLVAAGRRLWSQMAPADFDGSWSRIAQQMTAFTAGAQLAAAQAGVKYVPAVLDEQGIPDEPEATVRPRAFSGVASDGRSLPGLLEGSVVAAKRAALRGFDGGDALLAGQRWLEGALQSAVADAARDATAAAIITRPRIGYVRMVNPPCCSRCAVLAGRVYTFATPFRRHPRCDCLHIPTTLANADAYLSDPSALARRGLVTDLTADQRQRISDGDNLTKVLNESRDAWRERMAADRRAAKRGWGAGGTPPPTATVNDFMAHLTSRVDVLNAMKRIGIAA